MARLIQSKGMPKKISYFRYLKMQQKKMLADGGNIPVNSAKLLELESKEFKLFCTIKPHGRNTFKKHNNLKEEEGEEEEHNECWTCNCHERGEEECVVFDQVADCCGQQCTPDCLGGESNNALKNNLRA